MKGRVDKSRGMITLIASWVHLTKETLIRHLTQETLIRVSW
jgi:hypothetical protein